MRITPLALAASLSIGGAAAQVPAAPPELEPSRRLAPLPAGEAGKRLPIVLRAQSLRARPDVEAVAEGDVEFRRGGLSISADRLTYEQAEDLATAKGHVRIVRDGAVYSGPELQLRVQRFEGFFLEPEFEFTELGSRGRADRIDFIDRDRARATGSEYTSCPRDGTGDPDWVLETDRIDLDFAANEGVAEGAVLRFLGAPILALPRLSFPLSDARKSGWLPPSVNFDTRSGLELSVPYYLNIAPNRDATIAPRVISRRGVGVDAEFRYLEDRFDGVLGLGLLPYDRIAGGSRESLQWQHQGLLGGGVRYDLDLVRVSDDEFWKDFPDAGRSLTPRLLSLRGGLARPFELAGGDALAYARVQRWQLLQDADAPIESPYQRSPQAGVRWAGSLPQGLRLSLQTEYNNFTLPGNDAPPAGELRYTGERLHALGSISRPFRQPGWWIEPRASFNAAAYRTDQAMADGRTRAQRVIPTFAVDAGMSFERNTQAFGRALRQTLEPRLRYGNTPYREQSNLPSFDAAAKDFNFASIYSDNDFSGIDRVSDSHQITAGFTTRLVDAASGAEALRLGLVQRVLLRDQLVAPQADGSPDGPPLEQRFSDVLLVASTSVFPRWTLDASLQYSADISRPVRSIAGARYSPGPFRTVSTTYRLARGLSEQLEVGWQWPLRFGSEPSRRSAGGCSGDWYTVGRFNYSAKDSRITDSIIGAEYDAGCWIGRFVAERLSTGRSEATTRLLFQLELVGLSRLGSNPLQVLKDNIPGYRLLREDRRTTAPADVSLLP